jgi:hypothetical protein
MLAAMPHLLQDATQPSDEHMQVVRNSKAHSKCARRSQVSACRTLGSGRNPTTTKTGSSDLYGSGLQSDLLKPSSAVARSSGF